MKKIGIIISKKDCKKIDVLPDNIYFCYLIKNKSNENEIKQGIKFVTCNNCDKVVTTDNLKKIIQKYIKRLNNISLVNFDTVESYSKIKRVVFQNAFTRNLNNAFDYEKINEIRKDDKPKNTIKKIKKILKSNNYKVKEIGIKKNMKKSYSIRLELETGNGTNGKGISLILAKASAYAELMERLQSNMLTKEKTSISHINKKNKLYNTLMPNVSKEYKKNFFELNNAYYNTEKMLNIKKDIYEEVPINAVNCFCHTNGLASGNSFEEAVNQAIFEILERYCYQHLLKHNIEIQNINIDYYTISKKNMTILKQLKKKGYHYYVKDCSLGKYPVLGFLLFNRDYTKYTFTMGADISFNIALSRCITEMLQGVNLKELNEKMVEKIPFEKLKKKYKNNFESYNWLRCFNNNNGYLTENFFCESYQQISNLKFKNYFINNKEVLAELKKIISYDIYIKDYNSLGFDTYRVYIPFMTSVDCYDINDLLINKYWYKLKRIYLNILDCSNKEIDFFIDIFLKVSKELKYDEMIMPSDLFHINYNNSEYYQLDFTSLLIILSAIRNRLNEIIYLLQFKLEHFKLTSIKQKTYKIIINVIQKSNIYNVSDLNIEKQISQIFANPVLYLKSIYAQNTSIEDILFNKKSL